MFLQEGHKCTLAQVLFIMVSLVIVSSSVRVLGVAPTELDSLDFGTED
jgi:hypothetical protein